MTFADKSAEKAEERFAGLTEKEAAVQLQQTMTGLMDALDKLENNYKNMLHMSDDSIIEGGKDHGSD